MKLAAWFLFAISSASFAATMIVERAEARQQQACAEMAKPDPNFLRVYKQQADEDATAFLE
jgi:hypothetical protein